MSLQLFKIKTVLNWKKKKERLRILEVLTCNLLLWLKCESAQIQEADL